MGPLILIALLALIRLLWSVVTGYPAPRLWPRRRPKPLPQAQAWEAKHMATYDKQPRSASAAAPAAPAATPSSAPLDCEVLVVGAGPTGLMAAALLHRSGVKVRIVDKRAGPAVESRAFAVQARTIELFQSLGLADALMERGIVNTSINFHAAGKPIGRLNFDRANAPDTPYPFILMVPQCETEEVLLEDLKAQGITVERGVDVQTVVQRMTQTAEGGDNRVCVRCAAPDGRAFDISCAYLIGADGAHSIVRKQLGLAFEGASYEQSFLLADCQIDWEYDHHNFRIFVNGDRIGLFLPLKGKQMSRVMATDLRPPTDGSTQMTLDELQAAMREATQRPVTLSNPAWITRYRTHHRGVDRYSVGRVFLAGDAAHIHSPAGGQGMNTGLQDAANLSWKIAASLRSEADGSLLDSYHDERYQVGQDLLRFTDRLFSAFAAQTGWRAQLRDRIVTFVMRRATHLPIPHRKAFRRLSELSIAYPRGEFVDDAANAPEHGPRAGHRAPNADVRRGVSVFDLIGGYRFTLLVLSRRTLADDELTALQAALLRLRARSDRLQTQVVSRVVARRDARVVAPETAEVFERYGLSQPDAQALYLIRPDGYIAWRSEGLDFEACAQFLHRFAPHPPADQQLITDNKEVRYG